jgi:hypothetical protein
MKALLPLAERERDGRSDGRYRNATLPVCAYALTACPPPTMPAEFSKTKEWTPALDEVIAEVSSTGQSHFPWDQLKAVIAVKLEQVCAEYYGSVKDLSEPYEDLLKRMLSLLAEFPNAPFTVQRLCELLQDPHRIYATSTRKVRIQPPHGAARSACSSRSSRAPLPPRLLSPPLSQVTSALEKLLTVSSTVPTMVVGVPKPGSYQVCAYELMLGGRLPRGRRPLCRRPCSAALASLMPMTASRLHPPTRRPRPSRSFGSLSVVRVAMPSPWRLRTEQRASEQPARSAARPAHRSLPLTHAPSSFILSARRPALGPRPSGLPCRCLYMPPRAPYQAVFVASYDSAHSADARVGEVRSSVVLYVCRCCCPVLSICSVRGSVAACVFVTCVCVHMSCARRALVGFPGVCLLE